MASLNELIGEWDSQDRDAAFKPFAFYNKPGDSIEVYQSDEERVVERINSFLSVFVTKEDRKKVIGVVVKNVGKHFGKASPIHFVIAAGRAKVALLVRGVQFAQAYSFERVETAPEKAALIEQAIEKFGDVEVELEGVSA